MVDVIECRVNIEVYPLPVIFSTSYYYLEMYYIFLDKDRDEIIISLSPKNISENNAVDMEKVKKEFLNELLYQSFMYRNMKDTENVRKRILDQVFNKKE